MEASIDNNSNNNNKRVSKALSIIRVQAGARKERSRIDQSFMLKAVV